MARTVTANPSRDALNDSFLFELPPEWITTGTVRLRADIKPDRPISDSDSTKQLGEQLHVWALTN
jgi:hypothetical protein